MPTLASTLAAEASGRFMIGGEIEINRLGFGAMRITGPGIWGPPADPAEAARVLQALAGQGINFIDTADSYGPYVSESLIRDALHPYAGMLIATKGGLVRPGPRQWKPRGDRAYLRQCVEGSLKRLGAACIGLWQLHRIDPAVPRDDQFAEIREMQRQGLIRHVGLSQVTVEEIEAASKYFNVATVQNHYNLSNRASEGVLDFCEANAIGFIPWYPLADGALTREGSELARIAKAYGATPAQVCLAWLLQRSSVMLPIPGTGRLSHLEENAAAAGLRLQKQDFDRLARMASP